MRTAAATLAALLTLITLASYGGYMGWSNARSTFGFGVSSGVLIMATGTVVENIGISPPGWSMGQLGYQSGPSRLMRNTFLEFAWLSPSSGNNLVFLPLGSLSLPPLVVCFATHRIIKRRNITGSCVSCRYPRTGLPPTAPCPECGIPTTP